MTIEDTDRAIRETLQVISERLRWNPGVLATQSALHGQPLSRTQWSKYFNGETPLTDRIARAIAAVFSLPDPPSWTADRLRETLDSSWEEILGAVLRALFDDLIAELRTRQAQR